MVDIIEVASFQIKLLFGGKFNIFSGENGKKKEHFGIVDLFSYRVLNSVDVEQYLFKVNVNSVTLKAYIMLIPKTNISDKFLFELKIGPRSCLKL